MLARTYGPKFSSYPCYVQPKLNGVRALYQASNKPNLVIPELGVFQSRDEKLWNTNVLRHLLNELAYLNREFNGLILDGELYVHGWPLQRINSAVAVKRTEPNEDTRSVEFHVFDCIDPNNPTTKYFERFINFGIMLGSKGLKNICIVPTKCAQNEFDVKSYFQQYVALGFEGIMLRPDGPYEPGITPHGTTKRSRFLWKYKQFEDGEYRCIGFTPGHGKASIGFGALVLETAYVKTGEAVGAIYGTGGKTFSVGTGFTDEERQMEVPVGKLIRVRYPYLSSDGIPQCPSFVCVMD